jgi:hypothetical protein
MVVFNPGEAMAVDPIACTLLAAASVSSGLRRAVASRAALPQPSNAALDPTGSTIASERLRARRLNVPDSAIDMCLQTARERGQSDLAALRGLIEGLNSGHRRG